ncbi:MAG: response regulator [Calditrichaeota bacterium]|nr:response regulator [Calditrichota bacterium]
MRQDIPVSFESYYFMELLNTIQNQGKQIYDGEAYDYLMKFVQFLTREEDAFQNIENLANYQKTSDLAIFFSDILERLPHMSPTEALGKLTSHASDFLEIFNMLVEDEEWKRYLETQLGVRREAVPTGETEKSFAEFRMEIIREIFDRLTRNLPSEQRDALYDFLMRSLQDADFLDQLLEAEIDERMGNFVDLTFWLGDNQPVIDSGENYLAALTKKIEEWIRLGQAIHTADAEAIRRIVSGEAVEPAPSGVNGEKTFEELFEEVPGAAPEAEAVAGEREEVTEELTELAEKARELEEKKKQPAQPTADEIRRRKLLRDYVVSEVKGYKEEIGSLIDQLLEKERDEKFLNYLFDSLKSLKDVGKIHNYPGIELVADRLLHVFEVSEKIPASVKKWVNQLFDELPAYIDAHLSGQEADSMQKITKMLKKLESAFKLAPEALPVRDDTTLGDAFQEILSRYSQRLLELFEKSPLREWKRDDLRRVKAIFNNLEYWTGVLNLQDALRVIGQLKELLTSKVRKQLEEHQVAVVKDFLAFWQTDFISADASVWQDWARRLEAITSDVAAISVEGARDVLKDVLHKKLQRLKDELLQPETRPETFFQQRFRSFVDQLPWDARILDHPALQRLSEALKKRWDALTLETALPEESKSTCGDFLDALDRVLSAPEAEEDAHRALQHFLQTVTAAAEVTPPPTETEATAEQAPTTEITDEEIERVFHDEAVKYISAIRELLNELKADPSRREDWQKLGVQAHTLRGSAQMIGKEAIAGMVLPLEEVAEAVEQQSWTPEAGMIADLEELLQLIEKHIQGEPVEAAAISERIRDRIRKAAEEAAVESAAGETPEPAAEAAEAPTTAAEEPMEEAAAEEATEAPVQEDSVEEETEAFIYLKEKDPELVAIFKDEVKDNIDLVEATLTNLEKFTYDKKAFQDIEQAVHEIRTAAKMLGLSEIGDLAEYLEKVVEKVIRQEIEEWKDVIPSLRRGIQIIQEMTAEGRVQRERYESLANDLQQIIELERLPAASERLAPQPSEPAAPTTEARVSRNLIDLFYQETKERLEDINYLLLKLEQKPGDEDLLHQLMRNLHTLKGSAAMVNAQEMEHLAHLTEEVLEKQSRIDPRLSQEIFDILFEIHDEFNFIVEELKHTGTEKSRKYAELVQRLRDLAQMIDLGAVSEEPAPEKAPEAPAEAPPETAEEFVTTVKPEEEAPPREAESFIRMNMQQMDRLLNAAAELLVGHTQFRNQLEQFKGFSPQIDASLKMFQETEAHLNTVLKEQARISKNLLAQKDLEPGIKEALEKHLRNLQKIGDNLKELHGQVQTFMYTFRDFAKTSDENLQKLNKISNALLDDIMEARLVPIQLLFQRFQRPIRDLARKANKKIRLSILGEQTELDRTLIDHLYEPVLHVIRNAIDHGIEPAEERRRLGKPEEGLIEIKAQRARNQVLIEIRDDGRGIDLEKVKEKVLEKGLAKPEDLEQMSEADLYSFLFYPGFSTTDKTTLVSGRGVGLDAVKAQIEKIKGDLRIISEKDKGTTFIFRVPISLSLIQSMMVEVNKHVYSIPLLQVEETTHARGSDLLKTDEGYRFRHKGQEIPAFYLGTLLQMPDQEPEAIAANREYPIIIVQDEGRRVALVVDRIIRREEILIKSLGPGLRRLKYIAGGSIREDGHVVLVVDVAQIIQDTSRLTTRPLGRQDETAVSPSRPRRSTRPTRARKTRKVVVEGRDPVILIVDDSISIRKYVSGIFAENQFQTLAAKNGLEAMELLKNQSVDLIITDLEMPQMSGYEFIKAIRENPEVSDLPIIVLTGRTGKKFEELSMDLGADAYVNKPFKDSELLQLVNKFIVRKK